MTNVNSATQTGAYQYYPQNSGTQNTGTVTPAPNPTTSYAGDGYQASPYSTGYNQGVGATGGVASGMTGLSGGIGSMASSVGGIFGTIIDLVTSILNTIVNLIMSVIEGVLGIFGIGKKDKAQEAAQMGAMGPGGAGTMTMAGANNQQGVGGLPAPPPGTDINQAYSVVQGDVAAIQDPNQGIQIINVHAMKARDYRDKAEEFSKEAEKEARQAAYIADDLQKRGTIDQAKLAELQSHKSKAMDLLKTAQEYTKAVYDEALYAQAANDILGQKFQGAMGSKGTEAVTNAWKNWQGGSTEKKYLVFTSNVRPAPEIFMQSMNAVNANLGRATQVLNAMTGVR